MKNILLIDDDQDLLRMLSEYLKGEGFHCACAHDGHRALEMVGAGAKWDLMILDVMLPGKNGFEVLSSLRSRGLRLPVIMLTAKGESVDKIVGLEMGADDYLGKPFNPRELLARMRTVLRRTSESPPPLPPGAACPADGGFWLDEKSFLAKYQGRGLDLTGAEFQILKILVDNAGSIVQREKLFLEVLGRRKKPFDRSLDMHVSRLRKKIWPDSDGSERIKSIRGRGYILVPDRSRE
ncbi:MAG: response regulator transcription factor [Candidatus Adiutrix sp.]|jgi:two-component system response regulator CpxR|nr:response regulator transcription factor [Candidatus Adiutrix sp.]